MKGLSQKRISTITVKEKVGEREIKTALGKTVEAWTQKVLKEEAKARSGEIRRQLALTARGIFEAMIEGAIDALENPQVPAQYDRGRPITGGARKKTVWFDFWKDRGTITATYNLTASIQYRAVSKTSAPAGLPGTISGTLSATWKKLRYDYYHKTPQSTVFYSKNGDSAARAVSLLSNFRRIDIRQFYGAEPTISQTSPVKHATVVRVSIYIPELPGAFDKALRQPFLTQQMYKLSPKELDKGGAEAALFPEAHYEGGIGFARPVLQPWAIKAGGVLNYVLNNMFNKAGKGKPGRPGTPSEVKQQIEAEKKAAREARVTARTKLIDAKTGKQRGERQVISPQAAPKSTWRKGGGKSTFGEGVLSGSSASVLDVVPQAIRDKEAIARITEVIHTQARAEYQMSLGNADYAPHVVAANVPKRLAKIAKLDPNYTADRFRAEVTAEVARIKKLMEDFE